MPLIFSIKKEKKPMNNQSRTLNDAISDLIASHINEQPSPIRCEITHIYEDGRVDVETEKYGLLKYLETIIPHAVGDKSVLLFLNNDINERIVI